MSDQTCNHCRYLWVYENNPLCKRQPGHILRHKQGVVYRAARCIHDGMKVTWEVPGTWQPRERTDEEDEAR